MDINKAFKILDEVAVKTCLGVGVGLSTGVPEGKEARDIVEAIEFLYRHIYKEFPVRGSLRIHQLMV